jgi:dTDP-glucose pyrophosphorylase
MSSANWKKTLISLGTPIMEAMRIIDESSLQIALVVEGSDRLAGLITDGDIRRAILNGVSLERAVDEIMQKEFTTVGPEATREEILLLMKAKKLRQIPMIDNQGRLVDLKILVDLIQPPPLQNWVVLMAGGLGIRLRPFTENCPKPLLKVGNKPLLEIILENFLEYGFQKFFISVNYKAEMIEAKFGDGHRWGVSIDYLKEGKGMGTAGALGLLPTQPTHPLVVMNGDLLTKVNFQHLLDFHHNHKAMATMCIRDYNIEVPFGVVHTDRHRLIEINEKPLQRFYMNAGIYVLNPEVLQLIPSQTHIDMPQLFEKMLRRGWHVVVFPIREYWMDIGQLDDWERANGEFHEVFR